MISKTQIKALRTADKLCFDYYVRDERAISQIRAIKKTKNDIWEDEATINIPVNFEFGKKWNEEITRCFAMLNKDSYSFHSGMLHTITSLLREYDVITLEWRQDSFTNGYQEKHNLHTDVLKLHIDRNGKRKYSFLLDTSCTEDNSARMIQAYTRVQGT